MFLCVFQYFAANQPDNIRNTYDKTESKWGGTKLGNLRGHDWQALQQIELYDVSVCKYVGKA